MIRLLAGRRANGERGAVLVLTAVLVAFVAIGMLALTIDLGNITYNRAQLQNGADAAALSLASSCAEGSSQCGLPDDTSDLTQLAQANANASDQSMSILTGNNRTCISSAGAQYVTNHGSTSNLPPCADPTADSTDLGRCQPWPLSQDWTTIPYVEVTTQTKMKDGGSFLPFYFAKGEGSQSHTCSRAAWGPAAPSSANVLSLTMSECDWASQTGYDVAQPPDNQPNFKLAPPPVYTGDSSPDYGYDSVPGDSIPDWPTQHGVFSKGNDTTCHTSAPGGTAPGGFAWLTAFTACQATVSDGWVQGSTGANSHCTDDELEKLLGHVAYIPVFNCVFGSRPPQGYVIKSGDNCNSGTGNNTFYHISGYAAFYVSGWYFNPPNQSTIVPGGTDACGKKVAGSGANDRCIFGWFTAALVSDPDLSIQPPTQGDPNYGLSVVKPAG